MAVLVYNNHMVRVTYYLLLNLKKTEAAIWTCNSQKQWLILVWAQWVLGRVAEVSMAVLVSRFHSHSYEEIAANRLICTQQ